MKVNMREVAYHANRDPGDETQPEPDVEGKDIWADYRKQFDGLGAADMYDTVLIELGRLHQVKSKSYGTGSDPYANFTAVAELTGKPRFYYALLRDIEKATRCLSLIEQGRFGELSEEFKDKASLMVSAETMRRLDERGM